MRSVRSVEGAGDKGDAGVSALTLDRKRRAWRWACFVLLALILWTFLAAVAAHALVTRAPLDQADALVVFSGSSAYVERTRRAAELFQEGRAPLIILTNDNQPSGWSSREQRNPLFVERARAELTSAGVPAEKILVLPAPVTSTFEEAVLVRRHAEPNNLRSIIFVTSAHHSRRALWTARHVFDGSGIEVGLDTPHNGHQTPSSFTWWLHPRGWRMVAEEYPKLIYYRLWYR